MKVLVVGGGGREHALAWTIARSPRVREVWCAPGNGGIARDVRCAPFGCDDEAGMEEAIRFVRERGIDLTVVGPEAPLVLGIVDRFQEEGLRIFGPNRAASRLEGSKCYTKDFLARHGIPTADYRVFDDPGVARAHIQEKDFERIVIKADGLAAGKGVFVCEGQDEALAAIDAVMVEKRFGAAGDLILVEDFVQGTELTQIILTDGETLVPLETAQDYKPAFDGNRGPNTGGMGSYSPHLDLDSPLVSRIMETIVQATIRGLADEGITYRGALYAGLMLTEAGPQVLEYNVRFGDPECQAILMRLRSDLVTAMDACIDGTLGKTCLEWDDRASVCVVAASRGYPEAYEKGKTIEGIEAAESSDDVKVFCAGAQRVDERLVTSGGRVLGITALGANREQARGRAYEALARLSFEGMTHRSDIGVTQEG